MNENFDRLIGNTPTKNANEKNNTDVYKTPRQPSRFALYVKENYGSVKKESNLSSHKDVMQELSKKFKLMSAK